MSTLYIYINKGFQWVCYAHGGGDLGQNTPSTSLTEVFLYLSRYAKTELCT